MNSQLSLEVIKRLQGSGHIAYLAGGSVRDMLLGIASEDYDVATSASVEEITALFPKTLTVGAHFGVVIVMMKGQKIEVATFRQDGSYSDGRKPDFIERGTPQEDALRRDFTINGLFYDPITQQIFDFVGGREDLQNKILRAIGDPAKRFAEDRLRMLRAVRFALRFDLTIDPSTYSALKATSHLLFPSVSVERVWQEMEKMTPKAEAFQMLFDAGLLQAIFPHKILNIKNLKKIPPESPLIIFLALLFAEDTLANWLSMGEFFKCSHNSLHHLVLLDEARTLTLETSLYEWAHYFAKDTSLFYLNIWAQFGQKEPEWLQKRKELFAKLRPDVQRILDKRPLIDAACLMKEGIKPSPQMGKLLKKAEEISINERISSSVELLLKLKRLVLWLREE